MDDAWLIGVLLRIAIGLFLSITGIAKIQTTTWKLYAEDVGFDARVVAAVPWLELGLGIVLVGQIVPGVAALFAALLFGIYTLFTFKQARADDNPHCNILGSIPLKRPVTQTTSLRHCAFMVASVVAFLLT